MGWYNDKISATTAELALRGAGKGAKALGLVAQIPLDIDKREQDKRKLDIEEEKVKNSLVETYVKSGATIEAANIKANAVMGRTKILSENKHIDQKISEQNNKTKRYGKDRDYARTKYGSDTQAVIQASRSADNAATNKSKEYQAKLKLTSPKPVSPKVTLNYDNEGNLVDKKVVRAYQKEASGDNFSLFDEMESKAKKRKAR